MTYEPPRSDYNRRRLKEIDQNGRLLTGCLSCRESAIDSYIRAGWVEQADIINRRGGRLYVLTDLGRSVMTEQGPQPGDLKP